MKNQIKLTYYEMIDGQWYRTKKCEADYISDLNYLEKSIHKRIIDNRILITEKVDDKNYNAFWYELCVWKQKVRDEKLSLLGI